MLIGVDYPNFHLYLKYIRRKSGQPIARLTSLKWTCIGNPKNAATNWHQSQYIITYFSSSNGEFGKIRHNFRKFWNVEDISGKVGVNNLFKVC